MLKKPLSYLLASTLSCIVSFAGFSAIGQAETPNESQSLVSDLQKSKSMIIRKTMDDFSIFYYLGDVKGKRILDLGAKHAYYPAQFIQKGAAEVVSTDLATGMVTINLTDSSQAQRIEYILGDTQTQKAEAQKFDIVTGQFLLHYAKNDNELEAIFKRISHSLKPGGMFLGVTGNMIPGQQNTREGYYDKYGFSTIYQMPAGNGTPFITKLFNPDKTIVTLNCFNYPLETYQTMARKAGLVDLKIHPLLVSPEGVQKMGADYWTAFLAKPASIILTVSKPK